MQHEESWGLLPDCVKCRRDVYGNEGGRNLQSYRASGTSRPTATVYVHWDESHGSKCPYNFDLLTKPEVDPSAAPEVIKGMLRSVVCILKSILMLFLILYQNQKSFQSRRRYGRPTLPLQRSALMKCLRSLKWRGGKAFWALNLKGPSYSAPRESVMTVTTSATQPPRFH